MFVCLCVLLKQIHLPRLSLDSLAGGLEIVLVDFACRQIRPEIVASDGDASASHVGVEDALPSLKSKKGEQDVDTNAFLASLVFLLMFFMCLGSLLRI